MPENSQSLDVEEQQLKIAKLQHELSAAKKPFWRSVGFWLTFTPVVVGVIALAWDIRQDHLSEEAREQTAALEEEIRSKSEQVESLSEQVAELETERYSATALLEEVSSNLEIASADLVETRDQLSAVQQEFERVEAEAICTLGENVIENIAWLGTGLLFMAEDMTYPGGVARATEERYPALFQELGGAAFERRMDGYWENVWQDIPHYEAVPDVAFATSLVVAFVDDYVSEILGTHSLVDVAEGAVPRPSPLNLNAVLTHATQELQNSGPAGAELASRISDFELDPSLDSQSLMFFVDPSKVDLSFARSPSLIWDDVTLTEAETRIVAEEIERLLEAHFHASRSVSNLASVVLSGCPSR